MTTPRANHVAVLMPDQRLLIAGGTDGTAAELDTTERYDEGKSIPPADRPIVTGLPASLPTSAKLQVTGTSLLSPTGPASDGSVSHGMIQLRSLTNEQSIWLTQWPFTPGTSTSLTAMHSGSFPTGPAMVTVVRDGVPSVSRILDVSQGTFTKKGDVQGPDGDVLIEGVSVVDFGPATIGGSAVRRLFRFRNVGSSEFSLQAIVSSPSATSQGFKFTIFADEGRNFVPGAYARVFVDFSPPKVGPTKVEWWVVDSFSYGPILFPATTISGTGYATNNAGKLSFASSDIQVNEEDGTVMVPITRTVGRSGTVTVKVSSTFGSASAADFTPLNATVVTFADGEVTKQVPVTLTADAVDEPAESFTLTLSNPTGAATLLAPTKTTVRIVDVNDSANPTLTLTAPAQNAVIADGAAKITGTATDEKIVSKVQYSLNGLPFINATTTLAANGMTATFAAPLSPLAGPNVIVVRSVDGRGHVSPATTRNFYYSALRPLSVTNSAPAYGTLTSPFPGISNRVVGKRYSLTAKAKTGYAFSGWTMSNTPGTGLTSEALELPTISFIHQEGLALQAHFIDNPFGTWMIGSFMGLVSPSTSLPAASGTVAGNDTFGSFSASVSSTGAFTGKLTLDGSSWPVTGTFDVRGTARFGANRRQTITINRGTKPSLEVALYIGLDPFPFDPDHKITGTVTRRFRSSVAAVSTIDADRAAYNGTTALPPESLVGTSSKRYTMAILARASQSNGLVNADYPQGDGYATGTVSNNGTVTYVGRLADHTVISASTKLSITNTWTLFAAPYGMKGSFGGKISMDDRPAQTDSDMQGNALRWFRPYQAVQWYPFGWPEGILVDLKGAKYAAVSGSSVLPGLEASDVINGNATLTFRDGLLPAPLIKNLNISVAEAVAHVPSTDTTCSLKINRTIGLVTGTLVHPMNSQTAYQGVILQKGPGARAYGYFMSPTTKPLNYLGQSGRIDLHSR